MFRLVDGDHPWDWPVEVMVPDADGAPGAVTSGGRYTARFRLIPDGEIAPAVRRAAAAEGDGAQEEQEGLNDQHFLKRVLVGWDGIEDVDGTPIPYSADNLARLFEIPYWRRCTIEAYFRFSAAIPEKNSATPPAHGAKAARGAPTS